MSAAASRLCPGADAICGFAGGKGTDMVNPTQAVSGRGRTVALLHTLPDGSEHVDWMLESTPGCDRLITFRIGAADWRGVAAMVADRIADHRRLYLDYEGEVSGNRGSVARIASGVVMSFESNPGRLAVVVGWDGAKNGLECLECSEQSGGLWRITRAPADGQAI